MKYKRLVVFGCSFGAGHGINDLWDDDKKECIFSEHKKHSETSWGATLAKKLELDFLNMSTPGAGNKEILFNVANTKFFSTDLVLINWTFAQRHCIIDENSKVFHVTQLSVHYDDIPSATYFAEIYNEHDGIFMNKIYTACANSLLQEINIDHFNLFLPKYDYKAQDIKLENDILIKLENVIPVELDVWAEKKGCDGSHPSQKTYDKYSNDIFDWIKSNIK